MLGYMNPGSLKRTVEGVQVWFYSRSREDLWHKGEVSGNYLNLREAWVDCDGDTLLLKVVPDGPACHTENESCFFTPLEGVPEPAEFTRSDPGSGVIDELYAVIQDRKQRMPEGSYTSELLAEGIGRVAQKVTEEAGETRHRRRPGQRGQPARRGRRPPLPHPRPHGRLRREAPAGLGRPPQAPRLERSPKPLPPQPIRHSRASGNPSYPFPLDGGRLGWG